jgi:hypothetical protein
MQQIAQALVSPGEGGDLIILKEPDLGHRVVVGGELDEPHRLAPVASGRGAGVLRSHSPQVMEKPREINRLVRKTIQGFARNLPTIMKLAAFSAFRSDA